jgi:hypothetical protein
MPSHLINAGSDQVVIAFFAVIFTALCVRYWRITLAILGALLLGAALIALSVIVDLHIVHEITGYLHSLGRMITQPLSWRPSGITGRLT